MTISSGIFYFFFGVAVTLYSMVLYFKRQNKSTDVQKNSACRFYINIFFLDREEFVRNIVRSKVPKSRPFVRALAKRAAVVLLSGEIVDRIGQNLCKTIPERLAVMGIRSNVTVGYTQAAFVCIEVNLISVDIQKFIWYNAGVDKSLQVKAFLDTVSFPSLDNFLNWALLAFLKGKLMKQLPVTLIDKLQDKMNAQIELVCCTEEEQGPFLVDTIQQIKITAAANKTGAAAGGGSGSGGGATGAGTPVGATPQNSVPQVQGDD